MPLFRSWEKIGRGEKALWTSLMFVLVGLEIRTLYLDRAEHDADQNVARCREIESFKAIAEGIKSSIQMSQAGFSATIGRVDGVLKTTQDVGKLARENLLAATGGDSFAYVYPGLAAGNPVVQLSIHNGGNYALTGVAVTIRRILEEAPSPCDLGPSEGPAAIQMGAITGNEGRTIPPPSGRIIPILGPDGISHFHIWINAQNPGTAEDLYFRRARDGTSYDYKLVAFKLVQHPQAGDVYEHCAWRHNVKKTDWIEPKQP